MNASSLRLPLSPGATFPQGYRTATPEFLMQGQRKKLHVKSGCQTCKRRKVKCDEARPACLRCTQSGRVCAGYGIWGGGSVYSQTEDTVQGVLRSRSLRQYNTAVVLVEKPDQEKAVFEFFCKCPSLKISGVFKSDFWDHLLIQSSLFEPAIFHAVIAVGSAYRKHLAGIELEVSPTFTAANQAVHLHEPLMLQHYNKAISRLRRVLKNRDLDSLKIASITNMVFVCLELMQGQQQMAEQHYLYGVVLLKEMQMQRSPPTESSLIEAFTSLSIHLDLLNQGSHVLNAIVSWPEHNPLSEVPDLFKTARSAKQSLQSLLVSLFALKQLADGIDFKLSIMPSELVCQHAALQRALSSWKTAYQTSLKKHVVQASYLEQLAMKLLLAYHTMANIILGTCLSHKREISFDAFTSDFASLLSQTEDLMKLAGPLGPRPFTSNIQNDRGTFSIEMGSYPLVYYTSLKCRVPGLRRRAISLMQKFSHTEGIWNGLILSQIATKIVTLEEAHSAHQAQYSSTNQGETWEPSKSRAAADTLQLSLLVPEVARFHYVRTNISMSGMKRKCTLACTRFRHEDNEKAKWETVFHTIDLFQATTGASSHPDHRVG